MLSASPQWASTGFARRGVENRTALFEGVMRTLDVYTENF
jgi:hypothetical protein